MNTRFLFRLLALVFLAEIIFIIHKTKLLWSFFIGRPTFCTTFGANPDLCYLDYEEGNVSFLARYERYCDKNFTPKRDGSSLPLCPCIPAGMKEGNRSFNTTEFEVAEDGTRRPKGCTARQRVAIIVPYRNRASHLEKFLRVVHPLLERQNLAYQIFVIEQERPAIFNKAMLMNAGFLEVSRNFGPFDCFIFHDVDMIPLDAENFYVCPDIPRHMGGFIQKYDFKLLYPGLFGGATAFRKEHFEKINGFSNQYYGWGGEDDDILQRVRASKLMVNRFPPSVSRYAMIPHRGDPGNPGNRHRSSGFSHDPERYRADGLNSINYTAGEFLKHDGFAKVMVSLPEPPGQLGVFDRTKLNLTDLVDVRHWFVAFVLVVSVALFVLCCS